jgi:uncharacterized membrane protein YuzA (DUF378 family)
MDTSETLYWIALILVVIGGINWGLVGLFDFNLVTAIFGDSIITTIIYVLVALAALYLIVIAATRPARRVPEVRV